MSQLSDDRFIHIDQPKFRQFLDYLLANYAGLYSKVAPEGFDKSPYRDMFSTTMEDEYLTYRRVRASRYIYQRLSKRRNRGIKDQSRIVMWDRLSTDTDAVYTVPDLLSFEDFCKKYPVENPSPELAAYYLYIKCLEDILDYKIIIHDDESFCYNLQDEVFEDYIRKATKRVHRKYAVLFSNKFNIGRQDYETDLTAIYAYIFELLKIMGLHCTYKIVNQENTDRLFSDLQSLWADHEADRILHTDYGDRSVDEVEAERLEKLYEQELSSTPTENPIIEAYQQVYGKLMKNYPYSWM